MSAALLFAASYSAAAALSEDRDIIFIPAINTMQATVAFIFISRVYLLSPFKPALRDGCSFRHRFSLRLNVRRYSGPLHLAVNQKYDKHHGGEGTHTGKDKVASARRVIYGLLSHFIALNPKCVWRPSDCSRRFCKLRSTNYLRRFNFCQTFSFSDFALAIAFPWAYLALGFQPLQPRTGPCPSICSDSTKFLR